MDQKILYIIGGMGPLASSYIYKTLIDLAISDFDAKNNDEFPEIILHSIPVPDFISSDKDREKALEMLKKRIKELNKLDISCISIACNTAHLLLPELQKVTKVPFISMVDEVVKRIICENQKTIGIMGTPSTIKHKLYQDPLEKLGIKVSIPTESQIKTLDLVIRNVIAGKLLKSNTKKLLEVANFLKKQGAEGIILGCTELPLVFPKKYSLPIFNSTLVLAEALLKKYYHPIKTGGNSMFKGGDNKWQKENLEI